MKPSLVKLTLTTALTTMLLLPAMAHAERVTLTAKMGNFGRSPAYIVIYLTNARGVYKRTLWMAGRGARYYRDLIGWMRATHGNRRDIRGITGASLGSRQTLRIRLDLSRALFNAGYKLHIDAVAEDYRPSPNDIVVPLTTRGSGRRVRGRRYIHAFSYKL